MTVIFQTRSKDQNRYSINNLTGYDDEGNKINFGQQYFKKGVKTVSDKNLIKALMQYGGYKRGDYKLVTNPELVAKYLDSEKPDTLTREVLSKISIEGIIKLGKVVGTQADQPTLIKVELEGAPITSAVQELLDFYRTSQNKPQEPQSEIEAFEPKQSGNMNVREALEYMRETPVDKLLNFISEGEDRKTILEQYEKLMNEE